LAGKTDYSPSTARRAAHGPPGPRGLNPASRPDIATRFVSATPRDGRARPGRKRRPDYAAFRGWLVRCSTRQVAPAWKILQNSIPSGVTLHVLGGPRTGNLGQRFPGCEGAGARFSNSLWAAIDSLGGKVDPGYTHERHDRDVALESARAALAEGTFGYGSSAPGRKRMIRQTPGPGDSAAAVSPTGGGQVPMLPGSRPSCLPGMTSGLAP